MGRSAATVHLSGQRKAWWTLSPKVMRHGYDGPAAMTDHELAANENIAAVGAQEAVRVIVVDAHHLFRSGLRSLLAGQPGLEVVADCSGGGLQSWRGRRASCRRAAARRRRDGPQNARDIGDRGDARGSRRVARQARC